MRVAPPVALRTFVRSYAFNPKQTRKIVNNTTLALCSKFRDTQNREHVLSTSSLTCVTTQPQGKYSPRLHFISSSFSYCHVTHPFLFPKYYPRPQYDWVHKLTSSDVWATARLIEANTGKVLHEIELGRTPYPKLDLVVLHPAEEMQVNELQKLIESHDLKIDILKLYPNIPLIGQHLFYFGHNVDTTENIAYPTDTTGVTVRAAPDRIFGSVEHPPMPMGMCGGPVVLMQDMQQCIGIVEAIVVPPPQQSNENDEVYQARVFLQDKAVIIPSPVISAFLKDVDSDLG